MKKRFNGVTIGGTSVLTVLVVLCLTVFSVLALVSARADRNLSEKMSENIAAYYSAETKAAEICAKIGELYKNAASDADMLALFPQNIDDTRITALDGEALVLSYTVKISGNREFEAELKLASGGITRTKWQTRTDENGTVIDDNLPVWDGTFD